MVINCGCMLRLRGLWVRFVAAVNRTDRVTGNAFCTRVRHLKLLNVSYERTNIFKHQSQTFLIHVALPFEKKNCLKFIEVCRKNITFQVSLKACLKWNLRWSASSRGSPFPHVLHFQFFNINNTGTLLYRPSVPVAYRGGLGCSNPPPPPKFRSFDRVEPDWKLSGKCLVFLLQHPN
jgi:hypothetical protein